MSYSFSVLCRNSLTEIDKKLSGKMALLLLLQILRFYCLDSNILTVIDFQNSLSDVVAIRFIETSHIADLAQLDGNLYHLLHKHFNA